MSHPDAAELQSYRRRRLAEAELLALDRHLEGCPACRARLADPEAEAALARELGRDLDRALALPAHLSDDELDAFTDGQLSPEDADRARKHLADCPSCAALRDAQREAAGESAQAPADRWGRPRRARPGLAAALLAGAAAALLLLVLTPRPTPVTPASPDDGSAREAVRDGSRRYVREAHGWRGLGGLTQSEHEALESALSGAAVSTPDWLAGLRPAHAGLLGKADQSDFVLFEPVGTAVLEGRPRFTWSRPAAAREFVVTLVDARQEVVLTSPVLAETAWQPVSDLPPGEYAWQVAARTPGGQELLAPGPGQPEARLRVLPVDERGPLEEARRRHADRPLLLGLLLARAGAVVEARRELARAAAANPGNERLRRLAASLGETPVQAPSPTTEKAAQ